MKVLHTIHDLSPVHGGPSRSVPNLCIALEQAGVEVLVHTQVPWHPTGRFAELKRTSGSVHATLERYRPDVVHDHAAWLSSNHAVARASRGLVRVVSPRGTLQPWSMRHKAWKKWPAWWLYQRRDILTASALHATAPIEEQELRRLGYQGPIIVLPNGVEPPSDEPVRARDRANGERTAVFLSRIHPKKGLPMLIDAWARIRPTGWKMLVVGPEEVGHRAELLAQLDRAGLREAWSFEGEQQDDAKWRTLQSADLFILPSYSENFGSVVTEALVVGVPVLTTTGTPWQELVTRGSGWCVEPTVDAITVALREALETPLSELAAMGRRGAEWARGSFQWQAIGRQMLEAYRSLARS